MSTNYSPPVDQLLTYGNCSEMDFFHWPNYLELGLASEQIPDLIRMATDYQLYHDDTDTLESWAPVHAWRTLGQLSAEEAIEPLTHLFHKRESSYWEWIAEELPFVYSMIGPAAIPAIAAYLADTAHGTYPRTTAIDCLERIVTKHPDVCDRGVAILTYQLESFTENGRELNSFLITSLIHLHAVRATPIIERAFAAKMVDQFLVGDWDDVQVALGLTSPRKQLS